MESEYGAQACKYKLWIKDLNTPFDGTLDKPKCDSLLIQLKDNHMKKGDAHPGVQCPRM